MAMFEDEYEFDYDRIVEDTEDLYEDEEYQEDEYDYYHFNEHEYQCYYHNVIDEIDY
jgi:hypothetical protein